MPAYNIQDPDISYHRQIYTTTWKRNSIMIPEQRGGKKECYGCKDQLIINNADPRELPEEEEEPIHSLD